LLKATPGCSVCIEVHGDVSTKLADGGLIAEEDKSSIQSNPVTDRSTDLWKTLSNWVKGVETKEFDVSTTTFVLYRNKSGQKGFAERFDACSTKDEADQALQDVATKFADVDEAHAIWPYYKHACIDRRDTLLEVIVKFQLETGDGAGFDAVEDELRIKLIPSSQIETIATQLNGWLVRFVATKISLKQPAKLTFEEFAHEFAVLCQRARCLELLDFTTYTPPSSDEIDQQIKSRPKYLRQIELINVDSDDLIEAVTDFLRAKTNRDKWIEKELIDEDVATQFETNLIRFWKNKKYEIHLLHRETLSKEDRGRLLLSLCQSHDTTLRNLKPPPPTIAGTYHALADKPSLGWHDDWEAEFKE
jgi:hypothetical protein